MKSAVFKLFIAIAVTSTILLAGCEKKCNCNLGAEDWSHFIRKDSAQIWINNYKARYINDTAAHAGNCANLLMLGRGDDFKHGKWMMGSMMCRDSVIGLRIYYGIKTNEPNVIIPILVGVAGNFNDVYWKKPIPKPIASILQKSTALPTGDETPTEEGAMDLSQKIPPPMSTGNTNMFQ